MIGPRFLRQFEAFQEALPGRTFERVLDIGCGSGWFGIFAVHHLGTREIYLLDGDTVGTRGDYTYSDVETTPWHDVHKAADRIGRNVASDIKIVSHVVGRVDIHQNFDLIVSLRSCGHHYPVAVYLDLFHRCLEFEGNLVLDIRRGTDGVAVLTKAGFRCVARIDDPSVKCDRLIFGV